MTVPISQITKSRVRRGRQLTQEPKASQHHIEIRASVCGSDCRAWDVLIPRPIIFLIPVLQRLSTTGGLRLHDNMIKNGASTPQPG